MRTDEPAVTLLLTDREAAAAMRICTKTLHNLAKRGELRAVRIGRAVRYDVRDLERFIAAAKE